MSIFDDFKLLFGNNYNLLDEKNLWVLNIWAGNDKSNLAMALDIEEKKLAGVPNSILMKELYLRINKSNKFIKFPKEAKPEYELDWLIPKFKDFYGWSNNEIHIYWPIVLLHLSKIENKEMIAKKFGLENPDRKKLGLDQTKDKIIKQDIPVGQRRLF